jgi:hypothetical protein
VSSGQYPAHGFPRKKSCDNLVFPARSLVIQGFLPRDLLFVSIAESLRCRKVSTKLRVRSADLSTLSSSQLVMYKSLNVSCGDVIAAP